MKNRNDKPTPVNPSQAEKQHNKPVDHQREPEQHYEGEKRPVSSSDAEAFDDDYAVEEENKIGRNEVETEDENNTNNPRKGNTFNRKANED